MKRDEYYSALSRSNELYHHGVKGQKWGVRRYQNYDGTRISGKKDVEFIQAEQHVMNRVTNSIKPFKKDLLDISTVKKRGRLNENEAIKCGLLALDKFNKSSQEEPKITKDIISSVSNTSAKMYGLENRLKQPTSLAAKIGSDSKSDKISFEKAVNNIKDSVRYTAVSSDKDFVKNYNSIKRHLESKGYSETKCKNYFDMYNKGLVKHKAVQSIYKNKNGFEFEVQFHTPSSQAAKDLKVPIYEERRKAGISKQRANRLELEMVQLAEKVPDPIDVHTIINH